MTFDDVLAQVLELLQREQRVSYRALKRRFALDEEYLEDLKAEIIQAKRLAVDEQGKVLVWTGSATTSAAPMLAPLPTPASYTPPYLASKILTSRNALEGERKHVTVLFADVAGFTTLSEHLEPEDIHLIMDGCFALLADKVHHYEGTINQFTGDGIMALFGAPIAHEDHASRALHTALDIQTALRDYRETVQERWHVPLQMRLGLNTGMVVVGRIGDDLRMDYTAQGDTTNLAARMQQMASPGAIWVAEATRRAAGEAFTWKSLGPLAVKGKAEPVSVYELRGRHRSQSRFEALVRRGLTPLTGRNTELEHLLMAWQQAQQGQGQVRSVVGEAGFGKSRLIYEFKQHLSQKDARAIEGTCFTYGEGVSYLPFLQVVRALCGVGEDSSEVTAKRQIGQHLTILGTDQTTVAPYLHNLLALPVDDAVFPRLTPELIRQRTVMALNDLVLAAARQQPLALILEDVHWMDKATEAVIGALVETMAEVPLLLVLAYRPEYLHTWGQQAHHAQITLGSLAQPGGAAMVQAILAKPYAAQMALDALSPSQSTAMARELLGTTPIPPEVESLIVTKTDGNPLFIEELTRSLIESRTLVQTPSGYYLTTPIEALAVPTTVQGVLLARIDRLPEALKEILQVASVIGRVFSAAVLAHALPELAGPESLLRELEESEFIYLTSTAPQREYSFKHVLMQEAVYRTLLRTRREMYHACIGEAMEILYADRLDEHYEVLAYHYTRSANLDKAVVYLDLANQKAANANSMQEARSYFDHAMQLLDTLPDTERNRQRRLSLLVRQGVVMMLLLCLPEYYEILTRYQPVAVDLGHAGLLGAVYARLGWCEWWFGHFDRAIQLLTDAIQLCMATGNVEDAAQAHVHLQWSHLLTGNYRQVLTLQEDLLRVTERQLSLRWHTFGLSATCLAYTWLGRWDDAVEAGHKALHMGEEYADPSIISFAAQMLSVAYTSKSDVAQGIAYGEMAVRKAPSPADAAWSRCYLAWAYCRAGQPQQWVAELAQLVLKHRAGRFIWSEMYALCLGEGYWLAGAYDQARHTLTEVLATAQRCGMQFAIGSAHRLLGEVALCTDPAEAALHFEHSLVILQQIGAENDLALAYAGYGRLRSQQEEPTLARDYLSRALAIFERLGTLGELEKVRQELLRLPTCAAGEAV